jgi:UDP-N-acetylglucosamine--N-acetylmuramyl-(pentapeptide) pyrophosphoryl-undecaprenol N-acetylglucosamine transferase
VIRDFNPDCIVGFGSYFTLPILIAGKILQKPIFLHEANSIPGRVNRYFAPYAMKTWVSFPSALALLKGKLALGGVPLRARFRKGLIGKEEARKNFQLHPERLTLLVFGGSQGAKRINQLVLTAAFHLKELIPPFQVIHLAGNCEEAEQVRKRYDGEIAAFVAPFENRMDLAWAAADMAITRAGAVSIAEQMEYEVPGLLIPYPFSMDHHQETNADFAADTGLGIRVDEEGLTPQALAQKIQELNLQLQDRIQRFHSYKKERKKPPLANQIMEWMDGR